MGKISKRQVLNELYGADIWSEDEWRDEYWAEYWDEITNGEMSWKWYMDMSVRMREGWKLVIIDPAHKSETVINWIKEHYPACEFTNERNHFLIKEHDVATMIALRWA